MSCLISKGEDPLQVCEGLLDRPWLQPVVVKPGCQVSLVRTGIRLAVWLIGVVGSVAHLIRMPTSHNTQETFLRHPLTLHTTPVTAPRSSPWARWPGDGVGPQLSPWPSPA